MKKYANKALITIFSIGIACIVGIGILVINALKEIVMQYY